MTRNTAKLGGAASNVVVAKVAVSHQSYDDQSLHTPTHNPRRPSIARAYDDDVEVDTCPG
jgi:hypothetical protein